MQSKQAELYLLSRNSILPRNRSLAMTVYDIMTRSILRKEE